MTTCSIDGCEKGGKLRRGWCQMHYRRWSNHGDPFVTRSPIAKTSCSIDGCEKGFKARGFCNMHYKRWRSRGDALADLPEQRHYTNPAEGFAARTERKGDHLIWVGRRNRLGYGQITVNGQSVMAHRFSWEQANGPIPDGMVIDHICHTPACVLPEHLRIATVAQNASNRAGPQRNSTTGARGVSRNKQRYSARVQRDGVYHHFGTFDTIAEASAAASEARRIHFGEFAGNA